jgi:predicted transcriptional regulator of viral defense system
MRMKFDSLIQMVGDEPVFETGFLLSGSVDRVDVRRQLSRWTKTGRLYQLRRGLYALAPPFQKLKPHPYVIANLMVRASYVSLQSVLAHYGFIPEVVSRTTSVTTARPGSWKTSLGIYEYRHIRNELLFGYRLIDLGGGQQAFVAKPEKALLDLIYLQPRGDAIGYLQELRLQNLDELDLDELKRHAERIGSPKLCRMVASVVKLAKGEFRDYERI